MSQYDACAVRRNITEARLWSELPSLIAHYFSLIDNADGIMRIFAYASLIRQHGTIKLSASRVLPNEHARLADKEVHMNLLTEKLFAGLEHSAGEVAEGINITVAREDRKAALEAFIKRELGFPPWGAGINDIYEGNDNPFLSMENTLENLLPKYMLIIAYVTIATFEGIKEVPALALVTNPELTSSRVGKPASYIAGLLAQDSQSLDYFWNDAIATAKACGLRHKRLETIAELLQDKSAE